MPFCMRIPLMRSHSCSFGSSSVVFEKRALSALFPLGLSCFLERFFFDFGDESWAESRTFLEGVRCLRGALVGGELLSALCDGGPSPMSHADTLDPSIQRAIGILFGGCDCVRMSGVTSTSAAIVLVSTACFVPDVTTVCVIDLLSDCQILERAHLIASLTQSQRFRLANLLCAVRGGGACGGVGGGGGGCPLLARNC